MAAKIASAFELEIKVHLERIPCPVKSQ